MNQNLKGLLVFAAMLPGCMTLPPPPPIVHQPMSVRPVPSDPSADTGGAIFQQQLYRPLFEDVRARHIGDTLSIVINEKTAATKSGSSKLAKTGDLTAGVGLMNKVPGKSLSGLAVNGSSDSAFAGSGDAASANDFTGTIGVTVTDVLANGNMLVSGEKQIAMTQGTEYIRFSGVVNPRSISFSNTVTSDQVADARIEYKANGYLDEAMVMGWLHRFFLTILPF
ncbi:MAG TPA: flagellar basal body L-ring protein FlgH [Burkholderiales bacterium]|nr:flagellar basal body L-ring protein FlgH [Burkholderiales bacterium]